MLTIALTGGIGSGKSTVAKQLEHLGAGVVDADCISHALTRHDAETLSEIAAAFGPEVIADDGSLDRATMRARVFADTAARQRLEAILHPRIEARMCAERAALCTPYAVLVIPLLFETGQQRLADRVLVVDVPETAQIERVRVRSGLSTAEIGRIIAAQIPRAERRARADDLIDNSGDQAALAAQVDRLHRRYLALAGADDLQSG
ncbi:dephospho-CoA kinase [Marichromatium bheemlicum]|uniref:Dephospho-CoA kinase n=1 Tax=Marichromatium bheemlicum TaxID=365339 RepID=A0ABX1IAE4_9GAMM|nr:dephospho-CoA kinase [Marichromatium bheemlicum]NKN34019.1 dephospho-CoA kinase [Marichromatium bheemlicum]